MSAFRHPLRAARTFVGLLTLAVPALSQQLAADVNLTASEGFGARHHGMALQRAGFGQGADVVVNAPASMNDVNDFTFTTAHAERFGLARFDNASLLIPLDARSTLGIAVATYAVSDVELYRTNTPGAPDGYFSTSDWMVTGSFARRYGPADGALDIGGSLHILRRQLDQSGLGMRGDGMVQYTHDDRLRFGAFVRSLVPSTATWSEGRTEYELPEAVLFIATRKHVPYFYGTLEAGFETPGLLQPGARSATSLEGERGVTDPVSALKTSKVGAEFNFDFGLSIRAGFDELAPSAWASTTRLGMGYNWRNIVAVDYAFAVHPYLDESHRVALRFTPSFPKFEGRNFRQGQGARVTVPPGLLRPTYPSPHSPGREDVEDAQFEMTEPAPATPVIPATPAAPRSPSVVPREADRVAPQTPTPAPTPVAPREVLEEVLEEGDFLEE
jgi:hypothetical protein